MTAVHGYSYDQSLPDSPVTGGDLDLLLQTLLWTDDDAAALRQAGEVLEGQIEDVLDIWYGFVGSHPHLVKSFNGADGQPSGAYLAAVRARFGQWIRDLCSRPWDDTWLAYQQEIARRHITTMGATDGVGSAETHIPLRYLVAFIWPITATVRGFLANQGHTEAEVEAMHAAWFKAVTLTVALWSEPYAPSAW